MSHSLLVQQDSGAGGPHLPDPELQDMELCEATVQESTEATLEEGTEGWAWGCQNRTRLHHSVYLHLDVICSSDPMTEG